MPLRDDYSGDFNPELTLSHFSRQALAGLGREFLLSGHLQDRVGLPLVAKRFGGDAYVEFSISEWMTASPIYSRRMQKALGFEGHDVSTVFKNLQLDIGAPHQFMDFQFRLDRPDYGEFWLPHCGALLDVEPFGEKRVRLMCHDIEDPTFDATAAATHPFMKARPIHRPPRTSTDQTPACRWSVFIEEEETEKKAFVPHPNAEAVESSRLAKIELQASPHEMEPGGWADYSGAFDPGFQLEDLSHSALITANKEFAIQSHLLARSFMLCAAQKLDIEASRELGRAQWTGIAALTAERLISSLGIQGNDIEAVAKIFQVHPCFHPREYVDFHVEVQGPQRALISLGPCPALSESDAFSWIADLSEAVHPALDAIAGRVSTHARCHPTSPPPGRALAWDIVIDPDSPPQPEPQELKLARISGGAKFSFEQRRPLRS